MDSTAMPAKDILGTIDLRLFIGGGWQGSSDGKGFPVEDPSTGRALARVEDATPEDALHGLAAASSAQASWATTSPLARADILRRAYDQLIADADRFARLIRLETGKPLEEAHGEVRYAAGFLRWFSEEAVRVYGRYQIAPAGGVQHLISRKPVGPCLLITPWNFPLAMLTRKVGPAIAAGCTMIVKPAELTPLTASAFAALMSDAGVPPGVLNLIPTTRAEDVVGALLADGRLKKVSFTGSTRIGRIILAGAAQNILRTSMELGGNAPFIVFEDADIKAAVAGAVQAKLRNAGQACTAANRFYVHSSVYDEFIDRLREAFTRIGSGVAVSGDDAIGPLITRAARAAIHEKVLGAISEGARLVCGGAIPSGPGAFYPPTILADVPHEAAIMRAELFGPVAPVSRFKHQDEVIDLANDSELGLAAYVYSGDLERALHVKDCLQTGMLGINTGLVSDPAAPFGGVKQSGLGREGGADGIDEYLSIQYAAISSRY